MKSHHLLLSVVVMALSTLAFAQSHEHNSNAQSSGAPQAKAEKSDAQKALDQLKTVAGEWEGPVTVDPPQPQWEGAKKPLHVSMRVTSRGHAIVHELQETGTPLDPSKYDHPVTMLYVDTDRLMLTHYCDAGNRPRMTGKESPDGKKVEFEFLDLSGSNQYGHMHHAVFTFIDANHHIEDWTYMTPGDKPIHAHFDLKRVSGGASGQ
jgi:hypothetical protein